VTGRGVLVLASRRALAQAQELRLGVLENEVEAAICAGRKKARGPNGVTLARDERIVYLRPTVAAVAAKDGFTGGGRRRWRVLRLVRLPNSNNGCKGGER